MYDLDLNKMFGKMIGEQVQKEVEKEVKKYKKEVLAYRRVLGDMGNCITKILDGGGSNLKRCVICGAILSPKQEIYCSNECKWEASRKNNKKELINKQVKKKGKGKKMVSFLKKGKNIELCDIIMSFKHRFGARDVVDAWLKNGFYLKYEYKMVHNRANNYINDLRNAGAIMLVQKSNVGAYKYSITPYGLGKYGQLKKQVLQLKETKQDTPKEEIINVSDTTQKVKQSYDIINHGTHKERNWKTAIINKVLKREKDNQRELRRRR